MKIKDPIIFPTGSGFLPGVKAVVMTNSTELSRPSEIIPLTSTGKKYRGVVPWGANNALPQEIIQKVGQSPDLSTGLLFNTQVGYGDGIIACRYEVTSSGNKKLVPVYDNGEINEFFEANDITGYLLEQMTDLHFFNNVFPELILNRENPEKRKVICLTSKEATFSRWEAMNPVSGMIEHHFYSAKWAEGTPTEGQYEVTPVLDANRPAQDLLQRIGRIPRKDGRIHDDKNFRYIVPVNFPTPGRVYYQKPYWYSIIESGWLDFALAIPEFKKYLIQNGMTIRYIIYLSDDYFPDIFSREGIIEAEKQKERIKKEYDDLNKYITGLKNTGKSMISFYKAAPDGKKVYRIEIQTVENKFKGGEYLEDSGEVSNMIAYTLGVHPHIIGAAPGKNTGGFSGTDKRELFIIKQALTKPIRHLLLRPLYVVKKINRWPEDIHFAISDIVLRTVDLTTGNFKVVG